MAAGDIYRATIVWTLHGQTCNYVVHFKDKNGAGTATALTTFLLTNWTNFIRLLMSNEAVFVSVGAARITGGVIDENTRVFPAGTTGNVASACPDSYIAEVWTKRTALFGRSRRGRLFVGAIPGSHITAGQLNSTGNTAHSGSAGTIITQLGASGSNATWMYGVWSKRIGGSGILADPAGFAGVTQINIHSILGTQRKRKIGVGS